mgnify:CR=1 FL=1
MILSRQLFGKMNTEKPKGFKRAEEKAKKILTDEGKVNALLNSAFEKASKQKKNLKSVWVDIQTLFRLVHSWIKGEYKEVPWKTIMYATAAVLYFVNPLDVIPDFIPISGYLDDIIVISFVIRSLKTDLDKFNHWEKEIKPTI